VTLGRIYSSPKELDLEEHTVTEGLRRIGFPETLMAVSQAHHG